MNTAAAAPPFRRLLKAYRRLSLRRKLVLLISSVALLVTLASMVVSFAIEIALFRDRLLVEYQTTARMIATNLEAAVEFQDEYDTADILSALSQKKHIVDAHVLLADGRQLAVFQRDGHRAPIEPPSSSVESGLDGNMLAVNQLIMLDGDPIGRVIIRAELDEMASFISARIIVFVALLVIALLFAMLLAVRLGNHLSKPILDLATTARRITQEQDISSRQERTTEDETGQLVDAFNEMMAEIEKREIALLLAKERAEASSRAKDDFLSIISHELRTPLNPIIGYIEILLRNSKDESDRKQLGLVRQYSQHLQGLIDRVIDYSRFERGVIEFSEEPVDFRLLCHNAITLMERDASQKGIALSYEHITRDKSLPQSTTISIDRVKLQQIILNLLANAVKFTDAGSVKIRSVLDSAEDQSPQLRIEVQDTGIGIDRRHSEKVFQPFSQIDTSLTRKHSGMGLGLAITQKIVAALGGQIDYHSEKGRGSTFYFTIPVTLTEEKDAAQSEPTVTALDKHGEPCRVLLVDDQMVNLELGEAMLTSCGYEVVCARSGLEAVKRAKEQSFSLIILDIKMPKMNGYETARELRRLETGDQHVPIIAMTAHVTTRGNEESAAAGMDDFLKKPFDTECLNLITRKWLSSK